MGRATPGQFDRRIIIQARAKTQDSFGQAEDTWTAVGTVYAKYEPAGGLEDYRAQMGQRYAKNIAKFTVRWRTDIQFSQSTHRISFNGYIWDIIDVDEIGRRDLVVLMAAAKAT